MNSESYQEGQSFITKFLIKTQGTIKYFCDFQFQTHWKQTFRILSELTDIFKHKEIRIYMCCSECVNFMKFSSSFRVKNSLGEILPLKIEIMLNPNQSASLYISQYCDQIHPPEVMIQ